MFKSFCILFLINGIVSCSFEKNNTQKLTKRISSDSVISNKIIRKDTILTWNNFSISIHNAKSNFKDYIIYLPGYNHSPLNIFEKTRIGKTLLDSGFTILLFYMNKSVYASRNFEETSETLKNEVKLGFITDSILPFLVSKNFIEENKNINLIGYSTGARGAFLIDVYNKTRFKKIVAVAGDYDQTMNTKDKLMELQYGKYILNKNRWKEIDNVIYLSDKINANALIIHGKKDNVVSYLHSKSLYNKIKFNKGNILIIDENAGHSYQLFDNHTNQIVNFLTNN